MFAIDAAARARLNALSRLAETTPDNRTGLLVLLLVLLTLGARTAVWRLVLLLILGLLLVLCSFGVGHLELWVKFSGSLLLGLILPYFVRPGYLRRIQYLINLLFFVET